MSLRGTGRGGFIERALETASVLWDSGLWHPRVLASLRAASARWGPTVAAGFAAAAARDPEGIAVIDDVRRVSFRDLDARSNAIATGLATLGVRCGDGVGLLCRNHAGFVEASVALAKLGANTLLLNTGFGAPQLGDVVDREDVQVLIADQEFAPMITEGAPDRLLVVGWHEGTARGLTLATLATAHATDPPPPPARPGRMTILTSGTTGTPKGARREPKQASLDMVVGLLGRLPLRVGTTTFIVAPMFHSWGGAHLFMASLLGCTTVTRRRFDPEDTLATVQRSRPRTMAVVPVMLQRILQLGDDVLRRYDTSSLEVVAASGSALPGELALRWMNAFGDTLYNFYGSTEVAQASIATPDELRAAPGTAGRPPRGTVVKIVDEAGRDLPMGRTGRIFVANEAQFDGYTGGGGKEAVAGAMSSGDVGYFDRSGLLFVTGRDDEMIVSGGENVFPKEVEDLLADHDEIVEAAALGVPDDEFGQRLVAFVVRRAGSTVDEATLKDHVKQRLARYKVPREIRFLDELPRNPTGKVLKRELRGLV
jgi:acyl-CoA synthetase (AMP-forming)/AMP-acid ligase II